MSFTVSMAFEAALKTRLEGIHLDLSQQLIDGSAADWADYREKVGYARAIKDVIAFHCDEVRKSVEKR